MKLWQKDKISLKEVEFFLLSEHELNETKNINTRVSFIIVNG